MSTTIASLVGEYTLTKVNGNAPDVPHPVTLKLVADPDNADKLRAHAKVANSMNGNVFFEDGKLKGFLMSTRMMGPPGMMTVEHLLGSGLMDGMAYTFQDKVLTMTTQAGSLEWTAA